MRAALGEWQGFVQTGIPLALACSGPSASDGYKRSPSRQECTIILTKTLRNASKSKRACSRLASRHEHYSRQYSHLNINHDDGWVIGTPAAGGFVWLGLKRLTGVKCVRLVFLCPLNASATPLPCVSQPSRAIFLHQMLPTCGSEWSSPQPGPFLTRPFNARPAAHHKFSSQSSSHSFPWTQSIYSAKQIQRSTISFAFSC